MSRPNSVVPQGVGTTGAAGAAGAAAGPGHVLGLSDIDFQAVRLLVFFICRRMSFLGVGAVQRAAQAHARSHTTFELASGRHIGEGTTRAHEKMPLKNRRPHQSVHSRVQRQSGSFEEMEGVSAPSPLIVFFSLFLQEPVEFCGPIHRLRGRETVYAIQAGGKETRNDGVGRRSRIEKERV